MIFSSILLEMSDEYEDQVVEAPVDENEKVISARDE